MKASVVVCLVGLISVSSAAMAAANGGGHGRASRGARAPAVQPPRFAVTWAEFAQMNAAQKLAVLKTYREFFVAFEKANPRTYTSLESGTLRRVAAIDALVDAISAGWMPPAFAQSDVAVANRNCVAAGWNTTFTADGKCSFNSLAADASDNGAQYKAALAACEKSTGWSGAAIPCFQGLFGNAADGGPLCVQKGIGPDPARWLPNDKGAMVIKPDADMSAKPRAGSYYTGACDRLSEARYKDNAAGLIADSGKYWGDPAKFDAYGRAVSAACREGAWKDKPVCKLVAERLAAVYSGADLSKPAVIAAIDDKPPATSEENACKEAFNPAKSDARGCDWARNPQDGSPKLSKHYLWNPCDPKASPTYLICRGSIFHPTKWQSPDKEGEAGKISRLPKTSGGEQTCEMSSDPALKAKIEGVPPVVGFAPILGETDVQCYGDVKTGECPDANTCAKDLRIVDVELYEKLNPTPTKTDTSAVASEGTITGTRELTTGGNAHTQTGGADNK